MKEGLCVLLVPFNWAVRMVVLFMLIAIHIIAAPIRAFIYWGRWSKESPGWKGIYVGDVTEVGVWCHPTKFKDLVKDQP